MTRDAIVRHGVLIADPTANMAALVATMLRGFGHQMINELNDPRQLRSTLAMRSFDLVILDEGLGSSAIFDLVRKLRADPTHPNRQTPIFMTSAAPDIHLVGAARDAGVTEFLRKPFSASDLQLRIASLDLKPRTFVEAPTYTGPDRRRRPQNVGDANQRDDGATS